MENNTSRVYYLYLLTIRDMGLDIELFKTKTDFPHYLPTHEDKTKTDFVKQRIDAMQRARVVVDRDWNTYQTMIDAIWTPYPDERSSSTVPLASSMIELFVAEATKIKTEFLFKAETSKHWANAKALEYCWNFLWRKNNWKKVMVENEYITAGFWTSVIYTWYESYQKIQSDAIINEETGQVERKDNVVEKDGIIVNNVDIRQFYLDNEAIQWIDDANDCAVRQRVSYDKFVSMVKENPLYKNTEYVQPKSYSNDWKTFITVEEAIKQGNYVEIWHYWNVEKDIYTQVGNGILIREHPMITTIDGEKALPFSVRVLGKKNYQIRGRGICEALFMFNTEVNNLRELLMDGIRRSNTQVLAIGNGLSFDGRGFSYDNEILTFDWKIGSDNFQQISGNPPNQAIFSYIEQLYRDISIYVGIDIQNVNGDPTQTAFQTEVQREASQKRINVRLTNRDLAFERLANLLKDLIQTYFPKKDAEWLYPIIEADDEELVPWEWEKPTKFRKKKGKSIFQVTPELLRGNIYIDVYTNTNATTISAVDREQKSKFFNDIGIMGQWLLMAKQAWFDVESILPMKDNLRDLASDYWLTVQDNSDTDEVDAAKKAFIQQLMQMKEQQWGQPWSQVPPEAWVMPQGWQPQEQPIAEPALSPNQPTWAQMTM